jgi:hypothetical protein
MMSFTRWLRKQWRRDDPVGDLSRDVRVDHWGRKARTLSGWERHLESHHACDGALLALRRAWCEWQQRRSHAGSR